MADHVSSAARAEPSVCSAGALASSVATVRRPAAIDSMSCGSTSRAAPPVLGSGLATTGVPERHRLHRGEAEALDEGDVGEQAGHGVEAGQLRRRHRPGEDHPGGLGLTRSPHPLGPTITSGHGSGSDAPDAAVRLDEPGRFLRGSRVPTLSRKGPVHARARRGGRSAAAQVGRREVVRAHRDDGDRLRRGAGLHQVVGHHVGRHDEAVGPPQRPRSAASCQRATSRRVGVGHPAPQQVVHRHHQGGPSRLAGWTARRRGPRRTRPAPAPDPWSQARVSSGPGRGERRRGARGEPSGSGARPAGGRRLAISSRSGRSGRRRSSSRPCSRPRRRCRSRPEPAAAAARPSEQAHGLTAPGPAAGRRTRAALADGVGTSPASPSAQALQLNRRGAPGPRATRSSTRSPPSSTSTRRRGQPVAVARLDQPGPVAHHLGHRSGRGGHHRHAGRHGLQRREPEPFVAGRVGQHGGPAQRARPGPARRGSRCARSATAPASAPTAAAKRSDSPSVAPHDHQGHIGVGGRHRGEGRDQQGVVLARLDRADGQDVAAAALGEARPAGRAVAAGRPEAGSRVHRPHPVRIDRRTRRPPRRPRTPSGVWTQAPSATARRIRPG